MNIRDFWKWLKAEFRWRVLGKRHEIRLTEEAKRWFSELPEERQMEIRVIIECMNMNPYIGYRIELEG